MAEKRTRQTDKADKKNQVDKTIEEPTPKEDEADEQEDKASEEPIPEDSKGQITELIQENRTLGETLEGLENEVKLLEKRAEQATEAQEKAQQAAAEAQKKLDDLQREVSNLKRANSRLTNQVKRLSQQVKGTPLNSLTPEEASSLFDRTLQAIGGISNFQVQDVNFTLKIATAKVGDEVVLVFPEPGAVDTASLHELKFNLRGGGSVSETK